MTLDNGSLTDHKTAFTAEDVLVPKPLLLLLLPLLVVIVVVVVLEPLYACNASN